MHSTAPTSTERDLSYYHCCCGCHVHTGAMFLAILLFLVNVTTSVASLTKDDDPKWLTTVIIVSHVCGLISCVFLMIGNCCKVPLLYIPFIVLAFLSVCLYLIIIVLEVMVMTGFSNKGMDGSERWRHVGDVFGYVVLELINIYIFRVVYRDYQYVKGFTGGSVL